MESSLILRQDWKAKLEAELKVFLLENGAVSNTDISTLITKAMFDSADKKKSRSPKLESLRETFDLVLGASAIPLNEVHFWISSFLVETLHTRSPRQAVALVNTLETSTERRRPGDTEVLQAIIVPATDSRSRLGHVQVLPGTKSTREIFPDDNSIQQTLPRSEKEVTCSTCKSRLLKKNLKRHMLQVHGTPGRNSTPMNEVVQVQEKMEEVVQIEDDTEEEYQNHLGKYFNLTWYLTLTCLPTFTTGKRKNTSRVKRIPVDDVDTNDIDWSFPTTSTSRPKKRTKVLRELRRNRVDLPEADIEPQLEDDLKRFYWRGKHEAIAKNDVEWKGIKMTLRRFLFWCHPDTPGKRTSYEVDS